MDKKVDSPNPPSPQDLAASSYIKPQARKPHDPNITFEEYHYYALRTREEEKHFESPKLNWREIVLRKKSEQHDTGNPDSSAVAFTEDKFVHPTSGIEISDEEWTNASRAFRTASWGACEWKDEHNPLFRTTADV